MPDGSKSIMPAYPYLFEKRKIGRTPSPDALKFPANFAPEAGYEVVPRHEAVALVAYLKSLQSTAPLFELPSLTPSTNKVEETNAPVANGTNAVPPPATNPPVK
jgi:hypothetical protein